MTSKKMTFEEALASLKEAAIAIEDKNTPVDDAIKAFEDGAKYYKYCLEILDSAEQKINIITDEINLEAEDKED